MRAKRVQRPIYRVVLHLIILILCLETQISNVELKYINVLDVKLSSKEVENIDDQENNVKGASSNEQASLTNLKAKEDEGDSIIRKQISDNTRNNIQDSTTTTSKLQSTSSTFSVSSRLFSLYDKRRKRGEHKISRRQAINTNGTGNVSDSTTNEFPSSSNEYENYNEVDSYNDAVPRYIEPISSTSSSPTSNPPSQANIGSYNNNNFKTSIRGGDFSEREEDSTKNSNNQRAKVNLSSSLLHTDDNQDHSGTRDRNNTNENLHSFGMLSISTFFSHIDRQWKFAEIILIIVISAILNLVTIIGNIMVLISFKMDRSLQTVSNYFLLSLALADLLIGLISMPLYTLYLLMNYWPLGPLMCDIWLAIDYLNSNAAVLNMLIISFDRYFSVTRPLTYRAKRTTKHACLMISCAWILSLTIWTPAIFTYPYYKGRTVQGTDKCEIEFVKANTYLTFVTAILAFYIPVIIMIYLYWRIWLETKKRYRDLTTLFLVSGVGAAGPANRANRPPLPPVMMPSSRTNITTSSTTTITATTTTHTNVTTNSSSQLKLTPCLLTNNRKNNKPQQHSISNKIKSPLAIDYHNRNSNGQLQQYGGQQQGSIMGQTTEARDTKKNSLILEGDSASSFLGIGHSEKANGDPNLLTQNDQTILKLNQRDKHPSLQAKATSTEHLSDHNHHQHHHHHHHHHHHINIQAFKDIKINENNSVLSQTTKPSRLDLMDSSSYEIASKDIKNMEEISPCKQNGDEDEDEDEDEEDEGEDDEDEEEEEEEEEDNNQVQSKIGNSKQTNSTKLLRCRSCCPRSMNRCSARNKKRLQRIPSCCANPSNSEKYLSSAQTDLCLECTKGSKSSIDTTQGNSNSYMETKDNKNSLDSRDHSDNCNSQQGFTSENKQQIPTSSRCNHIDSHQSHGHHHHHHRHHSHIHHSHNHHGHRHHGHHHHHHHHHCPRDSMRLKNRLISDPQAVEGEVGKYDSVELVEKKGDPNRQSRLSVIASSCQALVTSNNPSNKSLSCTILMHKVHPKSSNGNITSADESIVIPKENVNNNLRLEPSSLSSSWNPLPDTNLLANDNKVSSNSSTPQPTICPLSPKAESSSDRDYETRITSSDNKFLFETDDPNLSPSITNVVRSSSSLNQGEINKDGYREKKRSSIKEGEKARSIIRGSRKGSSKRWLDTNCRICLKLSEAPRSSCCCSLSASNTMQTRMCCYCNKDKGYLCRRSLITHDIGCRRCDANISKSNLESYRDRDHQSVGDRCCKRCYMIVSPGSTKKLKQHEQPSKAIQKKRNDINEMNKIDVIFDEISRQSKKSNTLHPIPIDHNNTDDNTSTKSISSGHELKMVPILGVLRASNSNLKAPSCGQLYNDNNNINVPNLKLKGISKTPTVWHSGISQTEIDGLNDRTRATLSSISLKEGPMSISAPRSKRQAQKLTFSDTLVEQNILEPLDSSSNSSSSSPSLLAFKNNKNKQQRPKLGRGPHKRAPVGAVKYNRQSYMNDRDDQSLKIKAPNRDDDISKGSIIDRNSGESSSNRIESHGAFDQHSVGTSAEWSMGQKCCSGSSPDLKGFDGEPKIDRYQQQETTNLFRLKRSINGLWNIFSFSPFITKSKRSFSNDDSSSQKNTTSSISNDYESNYNNNNNNNNNDKNIGNFETRTTNGQQQSKQNININIDSNGNTSKPSYSSHHPIQPKSERKAAKTLSTLLLVFIVTWLPYNILVLIKTLSGGEDQVPEKIWNFSYYLCYINSTINPLCYALCNAQFRRTYMRILKCKLSAEHNTTRRLVPLQSSTTWSKDLRLVPDQTTQTTTCNQTSSPASSRMSNPPDRVLHKTRRTQR